MTLIGRGTVVALIGGTLATTSIVNAAQTPTEVAALESYGELVEVDGKQMNVAVFGDGDGDGEQAIVLTPGAGTASPVADFAPVING